MRVANIIVAHKNPGQLLRLINQFDADQFHNFVHIDGRCNIADYRDVVSHPNVTLLRKRRKLVWTGFGFVEVTIEAMQMIHTSKERFFYTSLMSGMDFPIRPTRDFYAFLKSSYEKDQPEFFEIVELKDWFGSERRYERYHLINWTIKGRYFLERQINRVIPKRKFWGGLTPYGRASWFTATDQFVAYALKYLDENPGYLNFLKSVWCPDEFILNTIIMNSPFKSKVSDYLRHIDWSEGKANPKVFTAKDFDTLMSSGCYLARKFDEFTDKKIIDQVEAAITKP